MCWVSNLYVSGYLWLISLSSVTQLLVYLFYLLIMNQVTFVFYSLMLQHVPVFGFILLKYIAGEVKWWVIFNLLCVHQHYERYVGYPVSLPSASIISTSIMPNNFTFLSITSKCSMYAIIPIILLSFASCILLYWYLLRKIAVDFVPEGI